MLLSLTLVKECLEINTKPYSQLSSTLQITFYWQVLLGEGYYADRTSKQTTEILKRRGKALESQIESLKAVMQNLKAEASFFDATAAESAVSTSIPHVTYTV